MRLVRTGGRGAKEASRLLQSLEVRRIASRVLVEPAVRRIVQAVRLGGDVALRRYAARLDQLSPQSPLHIPVEEMQQAWEETPAAVQAALKTAERNIRAFATRQLPKGWSFSPVPGVTTGQIIRPLGAVGCYVPSGRYPLPSTLLMTVIPAQVAGVPRIAVVSPKTARETLAAAWLLGVQHFYRVGGAQAIAALAYGTATILPVDKIVGPGNAYVTAAKKAVSFDCAIDMLAGPTEIVVVSETGLPAGIASDLVAQAEHDPDALAIFITTRAELVKQVIVGVRERVRTNPVAATAIRNNGVVILTKTIEETHEITNRIAPEHLTVDNLEDLTWVTNAGSVFIGPHSAQPLGDYVTGPNHTLPTGGMARSRGGLSVLDFVKIVTVQEYTAAGLKKLGPSAIRLAETEGLTGHAQAIRERGIDA